ncbi:TPA: hypothetical protein KE579_004449 [Citrobacter braakii]|nr:hypothetical protein [Citrobacter braakii]
MNATEKDNVFYCDCGFSWRRGMSGSHNCEDGLRAKLTDMAVQLANAESKCRELAVECKTLSRFISGSCYVFDGDHDDDMPDEFIDASHYMPIATPATDAFLAEVRAQGVEMFAKNAEGAEQGNGLMKAIARRAAKFAAQLRKGAAL